MCRVMPLNPFVLFLEYTILRSFESFELHWANMIARTTVTGQLYDKSWTLILICHGQGSPIPFVFLHSLWQFCSADSSVVSVAKMHKDA